MDAYVKTLLTVIAACLLLQVAQGFGLGRTPGLGPTDSSSTGLTDRYLLQPIPMARILLRLDRVTGQTWTTPLQVEKGTGWRPIAESSAHPMAGEEDAEVVPPAPGDGGR